MWFWKKPVPPKADLEKNLLPLVNNLLPPKKNLLAPKINNSLCLPENQHPPSSVRTVHRATQRRRRRLPFAIELSVSALHARPPKTHLLAVKVELVASPAVGRFRRSVPQAEPLCPWLRLVTRRREFVWSLRNAKPLPPPLLAATVYLPHTETGTSHNLYFRFLKHSLAWVLHCCPNLALLHVSNFACNMEVWFFTLLWSMICKNELWKWLKM